jgi:hypothetical protein
MQKDFTRFLAVSLTACTLLGSGCAASYTPMQPERIATYQSSPIGSPLQFGYQYDALRQRGRNKKYAKKEQKHGYHVVAVRITNSTASELNFSRDMVLYSGDRPTMSVAAPIAAQDMKQGVWIYLLYLLLNFNVGGTTTTGYGQTTTTGGTFIPTGPFIAGGNILGATLANKNFERDLEAYDLTNRNIRPGETVYGLLSLRDPTVAPLRLELRTVASTTTPPTTPAPLPPASTPIPGGGK